MRTYSRRDQVPTCPVFIRAKIKSRFGILVNLPSQKVYSSIEKGLILLQGIHYLRKSIEINEQSIPLYIPLICGKYLPLARDFGTRKTDKQKNSIRFH